MTEKRLFEHPDGSGLHLVQAVLDPFLVPKWPIFFGKGTMGP